MPLKRPMPIGGKSGPDAKPPVGEVKGRKGLYRSISQGTHQLSLDYDRMLGVIYRNPTTSEMKESVESKFKRLVEQWRNETRYVSSAHQVIMNMAYQQMIGMGQDAIPLILNELKKEAGHWSWALVAITGEDPIKEEDYGDMAAMRDTWLEWARHKGIQ